MVGLMFSSTLVFPVKADSTPVTVNYGDITLIGGTQSGHFDDIWDLTESDLIISFTYDATGLVDDFGEAGRAWVEFGVREVGESDFIYSWRPEGIGVWMLAYYDTAVDTFDPDPFLDVDDILILNRAGGKKEENYNLPSIPPEPYLNHRLYFDRDGVSSSQALNPTLIDGGNYNTGGVYDIVIRLHANSDTSGTAYMTINGLHQGFETNYDWNTIELTPAGMTFTGDMRNLQVFYGLLGFEATHTVSIRDIRVTSNLSDSGFQDFKQQVQQILNSFSNGEKKIDKRLEKSLYHIERSLDSDLWIDADNLDPKHGHKVFNEIKKSLKNLMHLVKKDDTPQEIKNECLETIELLLNDEAELAETANEDLQDSIGTPKVNKELSKVEENVDKAEEEIRNTSYSKATDNYKKSWKHAQNAKKHAEKNK